MALHKDFPESPYSILDPTIRWFPADESLRESSMDKLNRHCIGIEIEEKYCEIATKRCRQSVMTLNV